MTNLLGVKDQFKLVIVPFVPSSECIIQWLFEKLKELTLWDSNSTAIAYHPISSNI